MSENDQPAIEGLRQALAAGFIDAATFEALAAARASKVAASMNPAASACRRPSIAGWSFSLTSRPSVPGRWAHQSTSEQAAPRTAPAVARDPQRVERALGEFSILSPNCASRNLDLDQPGWCDVLDGGHDHVLDGAYARPTRGAQDDDSDCSCAEVLLMLQPAIRGDQEIKAFSLHRRKEFAVSQR